MEECRSEIESESWRRAGRGGGLAVALLLASSCQSYEPRPLEPAVHRDAWHARGLEDSSLAAFLERLEQGRGAEPGVFDPSDGLSIAEGQLVALAFHPRLRLARLRAGMADASREHAGSWADPELGLDALWVTESVSDRWVVSPSLSFSIPLSDRLDAERGLADATQRAAERAVIEAEWAVWHEVRAAWTEWSAARLRAQETERLVGVMEALVRGTAQLAQSGELARTEAALFAVEQAQRANALRGLGGELLAAEQRLRASLGLPPEANVELVPSLDPDSRLATVVAGPDEIAARNPGLARLREEYDMAEEALRGEIARQVPDLTLGPQYETDQGQSRIGFLGGFPLPIWNANRQAIAEARVEREIARAAYETEYESLVGRWAATAARAAALAEQRADLEQVLVPLVDRQLEDATRLMQLGEGTSLVLLESLTRAHQTKLDLIETRAAQAVSRSELEFLTGPAEPARPVVATEETP